MKSKTETTQQTLRVGAYVRVSTQAEEQQSSLNNQLDYFTRYIGQHSDWELVDIYPDDSSGTMIQGRGEFQRMIQDAMTGKLDLILVKEVSRFSRNIADLIAVSDSLREKNVEIRFLTDNISTTDNEDEFPLLLKAAMAQSESQKISNRVKWGQRRCMERGQVLGFAPLGYRIVQGKLRVVPKEAAIVERIFREYVYEGKSTHKLAQELEIEGARGKKARKWSASSVAHILRNEKYMGRLTQQKYVTLSYKTHKRIPNPDATNLIIIENNHKPIVSRELWEAAQAELSRRSKTPHRGAEVSYRTTYWCSSYVYCGYCGAPLWTRTRKRECGEYLGWRCREAVQGRTLHTTQNGESVGCRGTVVSDDVLRYCVVYTLEHLRIDRDRILKEFRAGLSSVTKRLGITDTRGLKAAITRLLEERGTLVRRLAGAVSDEAIQDAINIISKEIAAKRQELTAVEARNNKLLTQGLSVDAICNRLDDILNGQSWDENFIRALLEKIVLYSEEEVVILYLKGFPWAFQMGYSTTGRGLALQPIITRWRRIPLDEMENIGDDMTKQL